MDLKTKVIKALSRYLQPEYMRLDDDDGISGFVVAKVFKGMSALNRQGKIAEALQQAPLAKKELQQILMIAGLTPAEYEAVGARIRVHGVKEMAGGVVEITLHGGIADAEYARGVLNREGAQTMEPKQVPGAIGVLMYFRAKGATPNTLTKEQTIQLLKKDRYIEVVPNA